jgi:broad specificity phosphatase PhoE
MIKTVWFVRHGETDWNAEMRWQGYTDIPLNDAGRKQAARAGEALRGRPLKGILSSDLSRARETAEIIAAPHGLPVFTTDKLREVQIGDLEGMTRDEVVERYGDVRLEPLRSVFDLDTPFPNGETKREALRRGLTAIEGFVRWCQGEEVAIVFHSLILRVIVHSLFPEIQEQIHVPNCRFFELEFDDSAHEWTACGELRGYLENAREATA